jgi:SET domain-containing protein
MSVDNPNVSRKDTYKYGLGVFALKYIQAGELISSFKGGKIYTADHAMNLPNDPPDFAGRHAVQFGDHLWQDGQIDRIARYVAHSCNPNCGIRNLFDIVSMRDIRAGEEITWDYAMTEDSTFSMSCLCGSSICRGVVGSFSLLGPMQRKIFVISNRNFISDWLVKKYKLY